jgi:Tfp pilus assembly protein PilE
MRTRAQGRSLDTLVTELEDSFQRLSDVMTLETISGVRDVVEEFGYLDDAIESLIERQEFLINMQLARSLQNTVDSLETLSGGRWFDLGISEEASSLLNLQRQFDITRQDAEILRDSFLEVSRTDLGSREQADALQVVSQHLRTIISSRGQATQAELDTLDAVLRTEAAIRRQLGVEEGLVRVGQESNHTAELRAQILERNAQRLEEFYARRRQQAAEAAAEELQALEDARSKTELLEGNFESLFNTSADSLVAEIARVAEQLGIATDEALKLALALPIGHSGITGGRGTVGMPGGTFNPERDLAIYDDEPTSRGGGGGASQSIQDIIDAQIEQIRLERELLSLNEEQRRIREIALEIENAYQGEISETERTAINAAAQQIAQEERLRDAMQERIDMQERLADTISQSFGDAFMSMVDGTKSASEAFRGMAREIIAELFRILVVEQMVESIRGGLLGAFGGGGGGLFGGRASGGSMMAGQPYLVGERGPEIVVPGRSATVMNHNLSRGMGGGSTQNVQVEVFVNDNGNFDARVREVSSSVVSDAAPRIIQGAERQILDQRRRGGVYKATFG